MNLYEFNSCNSLRITISIKFTIKPSIMLTDFKLTELKRLNAILIFDMFVMIPYCILFRLISSFTKL